MMVIVTYKDLLDHQLIWYAERLKAETRTEARSFLRAELYRLRKIIID
jgi:predicted metal-dependent HD superfamily phosphohydrolase